MFKADIFMHMAWTATEYGGGNVYDDWSNREGWNYPHDWLFWNAHEIMLFVVDSACFSTSTRLTSS